MRNLALAVGIVLACVGCGGSPSGPSPQPLVVVSAAGMVGDGFELLVNTDGGRSDWVVAASDGLRAAYPPGQGWGFVAAVLGGNPTPGGRPSRDLSAYRSLQFDLRGAAGGETIQVGIKDNSDPDTGAETKKTVVLTSSWQTVTFPLSDFTTADLKRMYLLFEIVFDGAPGRTVFFRDVRYLP